MSPDGFTVRGVKVRHQPWTSRSGGPTTDVAMGFHFQGKMQATCITADRVLAANSQGKIFGARRPQD
jgi:hypothetical protein